MRKKHIQQQITTKIWKDPVYFIAFGFGAGLIKKSPETWGTCVGIPIYMLIAHASHLVYLGLISFAFLFGVGICQKVSAELGVEDHPGIVWDEIVGYLVTMYSLPCKPPWLLAGFGVFRLLDIYKPQPIRWVSQHVRGGLGVMLDDVLTGIIACLILHLLIWEWN